MKTSWSAYRTTIHARPLRSQGLTWLETLPLIELLPDDARRRAYPLSWQEQRLLFSELPSHLARMVLFRVFTYRGRPVQRIGNSGWQLARKRAAERYATGRCLSGRFPALPCTRSEAHVRSPIACRRREFRGSAGSAPAQERQDHHRVLGTGTCQSDRGIKPGLREKSRKTSALTLIRTAQSVASH